MVLKLEVFETPSTRPDTVVLQSNEVEEARLQSYELGYSAGWEDATAAAAADEAKVSAELANSVQQLSFIHQEARTSILRAIKPVLVELTTRLLPDLAREALAPIVLDTLMPLMDQASDQSVCLVINPVARPAVERLLVQAAGLDLKIEEEPTLGEGQLYLRLTNEETKVDLDSAVAEITKAVHEFFDYSEKDESDGKGL